MDKKSFLKWIIQKYFEIELKKSNFVPKGLFASAAIIGFISIIIVYGNFFNIIDDMIGISKQPWYTGIFTKLSFIMISVNMTVRSLFTKLNNPWGRFKAAFVTQFIGFIGVFILSFIFNSFILWMFV